MLLDGGVRRGSDVIKALALGARAVMIGRAYLWGLAANGQAGVENVLDILRSGLDSGVLGLGAKLGPVLVQYFGLGEVTGNISVLRPDQHSLADDAAPRGQQPQHDRRHVGVRRQAHLAALEIDRDGRGSGARGGTGDGLYAAVAIHAGDLEDEFLSHVI